MEWISVKNRLPSKRDVCLIYVNRQVALGYFEDDGQNWYVQPYCNAWYRSKSCVSHWMPLPEPPEKQTNINITINVCEGEGKMTEDEWVDFVHKAVKRAICNG